MADLVTIRWPEHQTPASFVCLGDCRTATGGLWSSEAFPVDEDGCCPTCGGDVIVTDGHGVGAVEAVLLDREKERDEAGARAERMHIIVNQCARALGNGAFVDGATDEFTAKVPSEIEGVVGKLRAESADELRLEVAAFQGRPEGGLLGWESCLMTTRRQWSRETRRAKDGKTLTLRVDVDLSGAVTLCCIEEHALELSVEFTQRSGRMVPSKLRAWQVGPKLCLTPRAAMRVVEEAGRNLFDLPGPTCEHRTGEHNEDDCGKPAILLLARPGGLRPLPSCEIHANPNPGTPR
jgi:hypothetical protein